MIRSAALVFLLLAQFPARAAEGAKTFTAVQKRWWAFQKVEKPAIPSVRDAAWVRTPVDAFILAKLEEKNLKPAPRADRVTLIRRATLDLTGLLPTPEEVQAFIGDTSPDAFAKVVDRLLASPRYGERWARHWLDLARYADSEGFKSDETRPNIWRYRDYVIDSFNQDKPYDRFVQEQIAGDEMYPADPAALVATGFNRHFPDESNARNLMQRRQELLNDITDTVGATFLGLTYGCARCHDHKFDAILHKDYYRLQAYFANTRIEDNALLAPDALRAEYDRQRTVWEARTERIRGEMDDLVKPVMAARFKESLDKFPPEIQEAVNLDPAKRNPFQWQMYHKAKPQLDLSVEAAAKTLKGDEARRWKELSIELAQFDPIKPAELPVAQAMIDNGAASPKTHVLAVGVYDAFLDQVEPGPLSILDPEPAKVVPPPGVNSSGRRSALARWLTDPRNPLTARVMANRIWHYHFGRGIAGTPSDFGVMGERPSHRELLDHLSATFAGNGWSVKKLHREIMLSSAWQQSTEYNAEAAKADPENRLLWRYNRRRMEGEAIRDTMLQVAGRLNTKMYGPGIFPPLPPGVETRGGWKKDEDPSEAERRSVYVFVRRNTRYPMFEAFDMPDTHESCARRNSTVTAPQALELMNNELSLDWARAFAGRVLNDAGMTSEAQVERAYRLAFSRSPSEEERKSAVAFLGRHSAILGETTTREALVDLCHMLMNSSEFVYVN
ncbi:MAG: DUF1549 and DUF1553 domain-containing protein [Bryobacteraceae bacterium]